MRFLLLKQVVWDKLYVLTIFTLLTIRCTMRSQKARHKLIETDEGTLTRGPSVHLHNTASHTPTVKLTTVRKSAHKRSDNVVSLIDTKFGPLYHQNRLTPTAHNEIMLTQMLVKLHPKTFTREVRAIQICVTWRTRSDRDCRGCLRLTGIVTSWSCPSACGTEGCYSSRFL